MELKNGIEHYCENDQTSEQTCTSYNDLVVDVKDKVASFNFKNDEPPK